MTTMGRAASAALATALATGGAAAQSADDQQAIVRELLSGDPERVYMAAGRLPMVWGKWAFEEGYEVTRELADALLVALERENARADALWLEAGGHRHPDGPGDALHLLAGVVAATGNPASFDALVDAGFGVRGEEMPAHDAEFRSRLSEAIDQAWMFRQLEEARDWIENARNPDADGDAALDALGSLAGVERFSRERGEALEPWLREAMREVAILHLGRDAALDSKMRELLFGVAVDLAFALRDPEVDAALRTACEGGRCPPCLPGSNPHKERRFCVMDPVGFCESRNVPEGCAWWHEFAEYMQRITGLTYSRSGN
ncbi:MAG: hypothetical protein OXG18_12900 [Gemmatimonadetes bacterium]|nr:hypothetical protein [Gemmatimonadota bacterium]